jgi:hypothetical protein
MDSLNRKEHVVRITSNILWTGVIIAATALAASAADARSRYTHRQYIPYAHARTYGYPGASPSGATGFVYGPNRAPYGSNLDYPFDVQLLGHN